MPLHHNYLAVASGDCAIDCQSKWTLKALGPTAVPLQPSLLATQAIIKTNKPTHSMTYRHNSIITVHCK